MPARLHAINGVHYTRARFASIERQVLDLTWASGLVTRRRDDARLLRPALAAIAFARRRRTVGAHMLVPTG